MVSRIRCRVHGHLKQRLQTLKWGIYKPNINRHFFGKCLITCSQQGNPFKPCQIRGHCPKAQIDSKHILRMFSRYRSQNSAYTTRKSLISRVLCASFEQILFDMHRDILKNPTLCGANMNLIGATYIHASKLSPHAS